MNPKPIFNQGRSILTRRKFLKGSITIAAMAPLAIRRKGLAQTLQGSTRKLKAAIIGHTGHGDFGHEQDLIFNDHPEIEVVAVADPVASGRAKAAQRSRAVRQYADYRVMLEREKPQLVSVALRWTDQHYAMAKAALEAGAHVYLEKPFTQALTEADDLLAMAEKAGLKIVVAHQMPLSPSIQFLKKQLEAGKIGELLAIRAHGKQDARAGAEDMVVLGTHLFDLMRFLAGDARWCTANVLQKGREITRDDAHSATENIGPIAGDEIEAHFGFPKGVNATFTSRARFRQSAGPWGLEILGSNGAAKILTEVVPKIFLLKRGEWNSAGQVNEWQAWPEDPTLNWTAAERGFGPANRRLVDDWLAAIRTRREPVCSGRAAMKSLEMIMAVFEAGLSRSRVALPLVKRSHPLQS